MSVNYEDDRFKNVEAEKQQELNQINNTYNDMINSSQQYYNDLVNASNDYAKTQQDIQQANTDFAIEQINQQKDWAEKDYTREQKGAYADWRKQSNQYGAEAELMASKGLTNTGYSESSQVSMYNTYQNRIATARDSYNRAVQDYDNSIKEAQLANNSALADIAYKALQTKLQLSLEGFQYKNTLLQSQLSAQQAIGDRYYSRWQDVLKQINTENALEEEKRQFDTQIALSKSSRSSGGSGSSGGGAYISGVSGTTPINGNANGNNTPSSTASQLYKLIGVLSDSKVKSTIAGALKKGAITQQEATALYNAMGNTKKGGKGAFGYGNGKGGSR